MQRLGTSLGKIQTPVLLTIVIAAISLLAPLGGLAMENRAIVMLINIALVVGLYSFAGLSGVLSFGHMSFMGIGAYTGALITIPLTAKSALLPELPSFIAHAEFSFPIAILIGGGVAAFVALVVSLPVARLPALAMSLALFAVLVIAYQVESNWNSVTRGRQALFGVPTGTTLGVALAVALLVIFFVYGYQESRFGLRLRASRENELAAAAIGVDVVRERRIALVLSGFVIGVAGVVYAQYLGVFTPNDFYLDVTFLTIAMLVIGGTRSLTGAVIGPILVAVLTYLLQRGETVTGPGLQQIGLALAMLAVLIFRPSGLSLGAELTISSLRSLVVRGRRRTPSAPASSAPAQLEVPDEN
ncbi:MAG: branched-chain amino acid ABC transporter permease [Actinobacteria bacterium]|nr:branched-chain amino acid ABC transporter permease [Actinomycetota bacterium]